MAYEDLTIEEQQALQRSLLAPPPAIFSSGQQGFQLDPQTRMEASLGLLGNEGRFFLQMEKEQNEAKKQAASEAMAAELMKTPPLAMGQKAQELASSNPAAFASPIVQQALQFGRYTRQEQEQLAKDAEAKANAEQADIVARTILSGSPQEGLSAALDAAAKYPGITGAPSFMAALNLTQQRQAELTKQEAEERARANREQAGALMRGGNGTEADAFAQFRAAFAQNPELLNSPEGARALDFMIRERSVRETEADRQEKEQLEQRSKIVAQAVSQLPRNSFASGVRQLRDTDPDAFLSPIVQSAITAREGELSTQAERREKKQKAEQEVSTGKVQSWIATASPEALNDFEEQNPQLVAKFGSKIDARRQELSEMETLKAQLPATLVEKAPARLSELKAAADKWERSLPASLRKIDGFANRQRAVELAEKIQAMKDPSKKPGTIGEDEQALRDELADILFPGKDLVMIPEGTLENLVKGKNSLYGEEAFRPKMRSHTNDLISSKIPQSALGQPEEQP